MRNDQDWSTAECILEKTLGLEMSDRSVFLRSLAAPGKQGPADFEGLGRSRETIPLISESVGNSLEFNWIYSLARWQPNPATLGGRRYRVHLRSRSLQQHIARSRKYETANRKLTISERIVKRRAKNFEGFPSKICFWEKLCLTAWSPTRWRHIYI